MKSHFYKTFKFLTKITIIVVVTSLFSNNIQAQNKNGIIDLTKADFTKLNSISGNWEFYWSELLTPEEIKIRKTNPDYIKINGVWNGYNYHGKILKGDGYATFRVKILVPKPGQYSLKFHQILSSYNIWINGRIQEYVGKVGKDKESSIAHISPNEVIFSTNSDTIELVIQVSNYHHRVGGIQEKIELGLPNVVENKTTNNLLFTFFIIGAELIFALYFLFSFFFRQKDFAFIFFSIALIITIIFETVNTEMILLRFFPDISFELQKKLDFFSSYSRLTFFVLFLWFTYREYKLMNKKVFITLFTISLLLSLLVLFSPCKVYTQTMLFFIVFGTSCFLYFLIMSAIGIFKKIPFIVYSFLGLIALNIGAINDSLFNMNIIHTTYLLNVGVLFFFIGHSITLSLKFSKSEETAGLLAQKFQAYETILGQFLSVYSYDLAKILKIIDDFVASDYLELLINKTIFICECKKSYDNSIICGKQERNFQSKLDEYLVLEIDKNKKILKTNKNNKHILAIPILGQNNTKAILYLERNTKNFSNNTIEILEMLIPQFSTFIDNYDFYINLELLNKNLETIIERRTQLAFEQKLELEVKRSELSEKIEELKITANIVEDLNTELNEQKENLAVKNTQLEIYKKEISLQKKILEEKEAYINESISYAQKIQKVYFSAVIDFPYTENLYISSAKDIISGDFVTTFDKNGYFLLSVIDTTGINVSASFLHVLLQSIIEDILLEDPEIISNTAKILKRLRYEYLKSLDISNENRFIKDSFDISICSLEKETGKMMICAVSQPVIIQTEKEQFFIEPDNFTIGGHQSNFEKDFSVKTFDLQIGDSVYLFTDGFYKQIGESNKKKMGITQFSNILNNIQTNSFEKQKDILIQKFSEWKGSIKKVDDYTIVGFKFYPTKN